MNSNIFNSIERKISETKNEINRLKDVYCADSIEYTLLIPEMEKRLKDLINEEEKLKIFEKTESLKLVIKGENIDTGQISIRVLTGVLQGLQSLTDSIANALYNIPSSVGKIPNNILVETNLKLTGIFSGSFGIEIKSDISTNNDYESPIMTSTLNKFFDLLNSSLDPDKVMEEMSLLGSRTLNNYKEWLNTILDNNIDISIVRTNTYAEDNKYDIFKSSIPQIIKSMDYLKEENSEEIIYTGRLTGLNIRTFTFEFAVNDNLIKGKGSLDTIDKIKNNLGSIIQLHLLKTTTKNLSNGNERISWFLSPNI